jgi:hypothetical protein
MAMSRNLLFVAQFILYDHANPFWKYSVHLWIIVAPPPKLITGTGISFAMSTSFQLFSEVCSLQSKYHLEKFGHNEA